MEYEDVLIELGYTLSRDRGRWRTKPLYRDSDNSTSLSICRKTGSFYDFGINEGGSFSKLVHLTLGHKRWGDTKKYLEKLGFEKIEIETEKPKLIMEKSWSEDCLNRLVRSYKFYTEGYNGRTKIEKSVIERFSAGIAMQGKMYNRIVFPIFSHIEKGKIIGFAGRDITDKSDSKWKLLGKSETWHYPRFLSEKEIKKKKEVILVESVGDMLSLFNCGIENILVLFGIKLKTGIYKSLIELAPNKIIIALNNEPNNNFIGNKAAEEIKNKLNGFFESDRISINLSKPDVDFGFMECEEIHDWYNDAKLK